MFIILGGTGHVGGAVADALITAGKETTVVARHEREAGDLVARGAQFIGCDILDSDRLRKVLQGGRRAFLLNPPGDTAGDSDAAEHATINAMLAALEGSGLEFVVAQSTYGARPVGLAAI